MTAKTEYKKELYSLPVRIVENLKEYTQSTHQKKSHIVAEALEMYLREKNRKKWAEEAKSLIGCIKGSVPDIQEIKAHRYD